MHHSTISNTLLAGLLINTFYCNALPIDPLPPPHPHPTPPLHHPGSITWLKKAKGERGEEKRERERQPRVSKMINLGITLLFHSLSLSERLVRRVQGGPISSLPSPPSQPSQSSASSAHSISGWCVIVEQHTQAGLYIKRPTALNRMEICLIDNISASNSGNYTDKCTIVSGQVKKNPENVDRRQRLLHYCYRRSFLTTWD